MQSAIGASISMCLRWVVIPVLVAGLIVLCWTHGTIYVQQVMLDEADARTASCVARLLEEQEKRRASADLDIYEALATDGHK